MPSGGISFRRSDVQRSGNLLIPCGTCIGCQLSRGREWAIRCELELLDHLHVSWCTLTYDESNCPSTLRKSDLSDFVRRLRKRMAPTKFRFFASGEYGERRGRPHYHAILFGLPVTAPIQSCWQFGAARVDPLSDGTIAYVAGYCAKKAYTGPPRHYGYQPPFVLMSRRPGIGGSARRFVSSWRKTAIFSGREVPVPRFLHEAYKRAASVHDLSVLQDERDAEAYARTASRMPERLAAAEQIALARVALTAQRRLVG